MAKQNLFCQMFGHKYVKVVDNRIYFTKTCTRCGATVKIYYNPEDKQVKKNARIYR